jgi:hypothetical protein
MASKLLKKTIATGSTLVKQATGKKRGNQMIQYQEVDEEEEVENGLNGEIG